MVTKEELWERYLAINPSATNYESWRFGGVEQGDTDLLVDLVLKRKKTATAGAYDCYIFENAQIPLIGGYNIILNSLDEAVCITKTVNVYIEHFKDVSKEHAQKEGEGDLSLTYWREVHKCFFKKELKEINKEFSNDMLVVCEEFECVYPLK